MLALSAYAYAAENHSAKPDLNSVNMTLPGGGFVDDFGGPASAPGTQSGLAIHGGGRAAFVSAPTDAVIKKEIAAMKRMNKRKAQSLAKTAAKERS